MKERDKYLKLVYWSEEDRCYIGSIPGWIGPCCHGDKEIDVYEKLGTIVDEWIEIYKKDCRPLPPPTGKNYSGKFVLRTGPELHQALTIRALMNEESLNTFIIKALKREIAGG